MEVTKISSGVDVATSTLVAVRIDIEALLEQFSHRLPAGVMDLVALEASRCDDFAAAYIYKCRCTLQTRSRPNMQLQGIKDKVLRQSKEA